MTTDTALKFGPEWVRALSSGDGHSPPPSPDLLQPRYRLAEHRYGREEMLALFHKGLEPPAGLSDFELLFVQKPLTPMAFSSLTEDENRVWQRGINSDAVLKLMGRPTTVATGGTRGGRGGNTMDRGRGRARSVAGYGRTDEEEGQRREPGYGRGAGRGYDRDRAQSLAGWDRNGGEEWSGSSPRKDFVPRGPSDNWRSRDGLRPAEGEGDKSRWPKRDEEEGWKTAGRNVSDKWVRGGSGWREGGRGAYRTSESEEGYRERRTYYGGDRGRGRQHVEDWDEEDPRPSGGYGRKSYPSKSWDDTSEIPEWAAESSKEKNGSFDASGAFRGDEEENVAFEDEMEEEVGREPSPTKSVERVPEEQKKALPPEEARREPVKVERKDQAAPQGDTKAIDRAPGSPVKSHRVLRLPSQGQLSEKAQPNNDPTPPSTGPKTEKSPSERNRLISDEEGLDSVADDLVARLVEEDEGKKRERTSPPQTDSWYYRDPQGQCQGPFRSSEMIEWHKGGYFPANLLVRRACDEKFSRLDELAKLWGRNPPFLPGPSPPPITEQETPSPTDHDPLSQLLHQQIQQQQQLALQQQLLIRQSVTAKLQQLDGWQSLSPLQQLQLIQQHTSAVPLPKPSLDPLLLQQAKMFGQSDGLRKDPLQSILQQLQQNKPLLPEAPSLPTTLPSLGKLDPIQALLNSGPLTHSSADSTSKMSSTKPDPIQSLLQPTVKPDSIQSILQQLSVPGPTLPQTDRPWYFGTPRTEAGAIPPSSGAPGMPMNVPGGLGWPIPGMLGLGSLPLIPGQGIPSSQQQLWDTPSAIDESKLKEMEEQRRREEEKRLQEEREREDRKKQEEQRLREELLRLEEERKRFEEERRRFEEEKKKKEDELRKQEERERKRFEEEKRKKEEEARRLEEERRAQEERKRQQEEEKRRKQQEEEKRKKAEEDKKKKAAEEERKRIEEEKRQIEERRLREEELRQQKIEEERIRREEELQEQQRIATEKLQAAMRERALKSVAPWSPQAQPVQPSGDESLSLAEIQERESREAALAAAQERRLRELQQQQAAAIAAAKLKQQRENAFKWGQKPPATQGAVKSLAEIQAEEAAELARLEEKQRSEKAALHAQLGFHQAGVWSGASQSLSWGQVAKQAQETAQTTSNGGGFWDEVPVSRPPVRPQLSPVKPIVQQQQQQASQKKQKTAKEEETVKKIFEKTAQQHASNVDKFTQWCTDYLGKMNSSIDIPTFIAFMKDVESAYEVNDYVRSYLGDGKDAKEFAKQFVERRSKWRALQKGLLQEEDSIDVPARAVNQVNEFQEVKGKSRKGKKGAKKIDASALLGFSVTGASDRLNVGERDYGN